MAATRISNHSSRKFARKILSGLIAQLLSCAKDSLAARAAAQRVLPPRSALSALTLAALALPGLSPSPVCAAAEGDGIDFQYGRYREDRRQGVLGVVFDSETGLFSGKSKLTSPRPIEVDTLNGRARMTLSGRWKLGVNLTQDTWSGASPISTAPVVAGTNSPNVVSGASPLVRDGLKEFFIDEKLNFYRQGSRDDIGTLLPGVRDNQLTHTMSTASPEARKQLDFKLTHEWDDSAAYVGAGVSRENDFRSRFLNLGGRWDFNQKQTAVNAGLSYTRNRTSATLDPDAVSFIDTFGYEELFFDETDEFCCFRHRKRSGPGQIETTYEQNEFGDGTLTAAKIQGKREDVGLQLGLSQVLSKNSLVKFRLDYARNKGYMANPYKLVTRVGAAATLDQLQAGPAIASMDSILERRPEKREQVSWSLGYQHYFPRADAALHLDYQYTHDDWGIRAHALQAQWVQPLGRGWTVTPHARYYSQSSADFYHPYLFQLVVTDENGELIDHPWNQLRLPEHYSSDQRLSAFGALGAGITINKRFAKGISLEIGYERYKHAGDLKLSGGGEQSFADFSYYTLNAALRVDMEQIKPSSGSEASNDVFERHGDMHTNHADLAPAGVMFNHALAKSGDFMLGYRYMSSEQAGNVLQGSDAVSLDTVRLIACGNQECQVAPNKMTMNMHMLEFMYAWNNKLTLMVMPQWMDMQMNLTPLTEDTGSGHGHGGDVHNHQTGGLGDTGVHALFKLLDRPEHQVNVGLGLSAPTGDVGIELRKTATNPDPSGQRIHYGMQLGSGTWDFIPTLTYVGSAERFFWGAQLTGTKRLESRNKSGYRLGDHYQSSIWGGYKFTRRLAATMRGIYTRQGAIQGRYPASTEIDPNTGEPYVPQHVGPFDQPASYGGKFWDLGLGVSFTVPSGSFAGNALKFEWLQPLQDDFNGYQLERKGAWTLSWSTMF